VFTSCCCFGYTLSWKKEWANVAGYIDSLLPALAFCSNILIISKLGLCVEMKLLNLVKYISATIVLLYSSCAAWATADAETPEQELEVLRLILLEKDMHTVLAEMKKYGCIWNSEFIWFYAPEKISDAYRWGGELVIQFEPEYSFEKSIRFSFSGIHNASGKTIDSVIFLSKHSFPENCK